MNCANTKMFLPILSGGGEGGEEFLAGQGDRDAL